jgi:signal transduction histidine kinase
MVTVRVAEDLEAAVADRALDQLPDAVVLLTADGVVTGVNDRCRVVLGIGPDAVGQHIDAVLELRDDAGLRLVLPPSRSRVATRQAERLVRVSDPSGRQRPIAITGRWSDGTWVMSARSAGRREVLERVHGDVVATVSHEIRSPLASVKGFARTLIGRWERFSDEQKLTMLRTIDADADRVTRLLTDLLEVSRIDAGRVRLARAPGDLGALSEAVVDKARHRHLDVDRPLQVVVDPATPTVPFDADRIEQVLTNLVDNALEHGVSGPVTVEVRPDRDGVRVTVADTGPGVPEGLQETVFRKFGRGRSERRSGTGLGLYIGRGLTEAHGGRLWLDPGSGPGARFHLWLPATRTDAPG